MQQALRLCSQERFLVEKQLHILTCEELAAAKERYQHENDYLQQETTQSLLTLTRDMSETNLQNEQLKLEVLRWRKQCSLMRLKLASARENVQLHERNIDLLSDREQRLNRQVDELETQLCNTVQQLTDITGVKAQAQAEWSKYQGQALQANMHITRLDEEVKLANGRCAAAIAQATELQQQLTAARAENASLQKELDQSCGRDSAAAAAQEQLRQSLESLQSDLKRLGDQLSEEQKARVAAEAAAVKSAAAAEAAADALAVKEQQLAEWRQLERASKETATQQLQLSQAQLCSMRENASMKEAKLLDDVAAVKQQLEQEKAARSAAEAGATDASKAAAADRSKCAAASKAVETQLADLRAQVAKLEDRAAAADKQAAAAEKQAAAAVMKARQEADRAAALELEVERLQEQQTRTAVQAVGNLVHDLAEASEPISAVHERAAAKTAAAGSSRGRKAAITAAAKIPAGGSASKALGSRRAAAAADADASDVVAAEHSGSVTSDGDEEHDYVPAQGANKGKPAAAAKSKAEQTRSVRGRVREQASQDDGGQLTPQSKGKPVRQEDGSQQDTALPAAASSAGRRSRPSSAGNKQATDTAKAPAQITAQMPAPTASVAVGPPALSFVPQSTITPAAALQQPGVMAAAHARVSASDMLKKLSTGGVQGMTGKPGARKRKLGGQPAASNSMSMDVIPPNLLVKPTFQAPKVRKPGA